MLAEKVTLFIFCFLLISFWAGAALALQGNAYPIAANLSAVPPASIGFLFLPVLFLAMSLKVHLEFGNEKKWVTRTFQIVTLTMWAFVFAAYHRNQEARKIRTEFQRDMDLAAPFLSELEEDEMRFRFRMIKNKSDYQAIKTKLHEAKNGRSNQRNRFRSLELSLTHQNERFERR